MSEDAERAFIEDQLRRAVEGEAWHGPSVLEAMAMLDSARGCRVMTETGHSACGITLHIAAWLEIVRERMRGTDVSPTAAQDWPRVQGSPEAAWAAAGRRLLAAHDALVAAFRDMPPGALDAIVPGKMYDVRFLLHGVIQHTIYHAGQIALAGRLTQGQD